MFKGQLREAPQACRWLDEARGDMLVGRRVRTDALVEWAAGGTEAAWDSERSDAMPYGQEHGLGTAAAACNGEAAGEYSQSTV